MANEKRLIDANALVMDLRRAEGFRFDDKMFAIDIVNGQDTVDAVNRDGCKWCNGEYHTKIMATAIRYHTNGNMDGYELSANYCPNCGAKMDGDGNG